MCGITGYFDRSQSCDQLAALQRMVASLRHRGPDDSSVWLDSTAGIGLGHSRLSIIDLSEAGRQPMQSACGRYVMVFNGELYNYRDIRKKLEDTGAAPNWRGHSDTEVLLAAISAWGPEAAVTSFVGMFAGAVWDADQRTLLLFRDRLGEKPLYYGFQQGVFLFGSELKALRAHPAWQGGIDRGAVARYLKFAYVPAPYSIYENVRKLPPGSFLSFSPAAAERDSAYQGTLHAYWRCADIAACSVADPFSGSETEALQTVDRLLNEAVAGQMIADVPLGAFLSGGIDSSLIVALMQSQSSLPVKTFTIGFEDAGYNEALHAREVARHLGTEHTEWQIGAREALELIPRLPLIYDEPFADSSQIPTCLVAALTRRHVTVSLSGDAADELFGGYNRYLWVPAIWQSLGMVPRPLRTLVAAGIRAVPQQLWGALLASPLVPHRRRVRYPLDKLAKLAALLPCRDPYDMYDMLVSQWRDADSPLVEGSAGLSSSGGGPETWARFDNPVDAMMCLDQLTYLPDDILVKVDRAAMAVSLESRAPFLDHRVVEFAWRLPQAFKVRDGQGKWLLRQLLYKHVPRELIERPKAGFSVPIDSWLRGPLRDWAEELLAAKRLREEGYFRPEAVRAKWDEHCSGKRNWQHQLWTVLMFQAWLEQWEQA